MSRSRLQRKAMRVFASEREREAYEALAKLAKIRVERDKAYADANGSFRTAVKEAKDALAQTRKEAWDTYDEKRATILKAFAKDGIKADAAA